MNPCLQFKSSQQALDHLTAGDRSLERALKKEVADAGDQQATLHALAKQRAYPPPPHTTANADPFPAGVTACADPVQLAARVPAQGCPEGLDSAVWGRFLVWYDSKVTQENQIARATAEMAAVKRWTAFLASREHECGRGRGRVRVCVRVWFCASLRLRLPPQPLQTFQSPRIDAAHKAAVQDIQDIRYARQADLSDLLVSFTLKNGQLEFKPARNRFSFAQAGAVMVHKARVDALNAAVRDRGARCVQILREIKDFKRGTYQLLWDLRSLDMLAADATAKIKELQLLRVSKELHWVRAGLRVGGRGGAHECSK